MKLLSVNSVLVFFALISITFSPLQLRSQTLSKAKAQVSWIQNKGLLHPDVAFFANTYAGTVFITHQKEIVYCLPTDSLNNFQLKESFVSSIALPERENLLKGEEMPKANINYFKGKDKSKWQRNIESYRTLNCGTIWEGVSVKLKAYDGNIEKLFYVNPGGDPKRIKVKIEGADHLCVSESGSLIMRTKEGELEFSAPKAYQVIDSIKQYVKVNYHICENTEFSCSYNFNCGSYDFNYPLIIDPILASTFIGKANDDYGRAVAVDAAGNVIIAGYTNSCHYPIPGSPQKAMPEEDFDIFISKFSGDLSKHLASTYIGGAGIDYVFSLKLDDSGNVFFSGYTNSKDFPCAGNPFDEEYNGEYDIFVSKLSADLSSLEASTYLGGANNDQAFSMALDTIGNVILTGHTKSLNYPVRGTSIGKNKSGAYDIFISKLDSDLSTLITSAKFGGTSEDFGRAIVLDQTGSVFISGYTKSLDFPVAGSLASNISKGRYDVFVVKLNAALTSILSSVYIGGSRTEYAFSMAADQQGSIFVSGYTNSLNFPCFGLPHDHSPNGAYDIFVVKLNGNLSSIMASTYLGGCHNDYGRALALDKNGNVLILGSSISGNYPVTAFPIDNTHNGNYDVILSKFSNDLSSLLYSTFLGSCNDECGRELIFDKSGNLFICGHTNSSYFPSAQTSYDHTHNGKFDAFLCKLKIAKPYY